MDAKKLLLATQDAIKHAATIENVDEALEAIKDSVSALRKVAKYVKEFDISNQNYCPECGRKGISYEVATKSSSYITKLLNDAVRLMEFHKGNADSRTESKDGMTDLVKKLKSDQLALVLKWMDENADEQIQ